MRNVWNDQSDTFGGWYAQAKPTDSHQTPRKGDPCFQRAKTVSAKKANQSVHRQLTGSLGRLSKLRLQCAPSPSPAAQNAFSPIHNRQNRQSIPKQWIPQQSVSSPSGTCDSITNPTYGKLQTSFMPSGGSQQSGHTIPRPIAIPIQGLGPGILAPLDFCIPIVRKYDANTAQSKHIRQGRPGQTSVIQHIDVTTSWNCLRYFEAQELYRIHQAFTKTLERMLASELWRIAQGQDGSRGVDCDEDIYANGVIRGICFCRAQLVEEMADSLYTSKEDMTRPQNGLVQLYLAAIDWLVPYESYLRDTSITVRVHHDQGSSTPYPIVDAAWVPDYITFKGLNEAHNEGQEIFILPQYQSNSAFGFTRSPTKVRYAIESEDSQLSWLVWDDVINGFHGVIPAYSEMEGKNRCTGNDFDSSCFFQRSDHVKLCIDVKAVFINGNSISVNYERVVRARLTLDILPRYISKNERVSWGIQLGGHDTFYQVQRQCPSEKHIQVAHSGDQRGFIAETQAIEMSNLAQKHADLAAKYADIARRHADAEAFVKANIHRDYARMGEFRPLHHLVNRLVSNDPEKFDTSDDDKEYELFTSSPGLKPIRQAPTSDSATNKPSSTHLYPSQTFDAWTQAWERLDAEESHQDGKKSSSHTISVKDIPAGSEDANIRTQGEAGRLRQKPTPGQVSDTSKLEKMEFGAPSAGHVMNVSASAHEGNPGVRAISTGSRYTNATCSRAPSSNISFIVEGPEDVLSRSKQAQLWSRLSRSETRKMENQQPKPAVNETRLSIEEKKAIEDAVDRSLEELTGNFDNIFLANSDDSECNDIECDDTDVSF